MSYTSETDIELLLINNSYHLVINTNWQSKNSYCRLLKKRQGTFSQLKKLHCQEKTGSLSSIHQKAHRITHAERVCEEK